MCVGEYLGYQNCEFRKRLVHKLVEKYTENVEKVNLAGIILFEHGKMCVKVLTQFISS